MSTLLDLSDIKLAIIGLGYVGLPLAVEFGKIRSVLGFDINLKRIAQLKEGRDLTQETEPEELQAATHLSFSTNSDDLRACNCFIVTVPTPIDRYKRPDLGPLIKASETVGKVLKTGDIVIYESTVYPGCTEEDCVPVLEKFSGLKFNQDFFCGYSPERINPGDKTHRLPNIQKVTSGSTPEVADLVDQLYRQIITAGTHKASSIKVAEAAKVIENTQRDVNIALINELALIFNKMGIDTEACAASRRQQVEFFALQARLGRRATALAWTLIT
jgi:UDP-N-acetyl-D-glucosamine/UDP-N-acetyl-D-galactosamine dehydrogenase